MIMSGKGAPKHWPTSSYKEIYKVSSALAKLLLAVSLVLAAFSAPAIAEQTEENNIWKLPFAFMELAYQDISENVTNESTDKEVTINAYGINASMILADGSQVEGKFKQVSTHGLYDKENKTSEFIQWGEFIPSHPTTKIGYTFETHANNTSLKLEAQIVELLRNGNVYIFSRYSSIGGDL